MEINITIAVKNLSLGVQVIYTQKDCGVQKKLNTYEIFLTTEGTSKILLPKIKEWVHVWINYELVHEIGMGEPFQL